MFGSVFWLRSVALAVEVAAAVIILVGETQSFPVMG